MTHDNVTHSDEVMNIRVLTDQRSDHLYLKKIFFLLLKGTLERRERFRPVIKLCRNRGTIGNTYVQYLITTTKPYPNFPRSFNFYILVLQIRRQGHTSRLLRKKKKGAENIGATYLHFERRKEKTIARFDVIYKVCGNY